MCGQILIFWTFENNKGALQRRQVRCAVVLNARGEEAAPTRLALHILDRGSIVATLSELSTKIIFSINIVQSKCRAMWIDYQNNFNPDYYMGMTPDGASCGDGKASKWLINFN